MKKLCFPLFLLFAITGLTQTTLPARFDSLTSAYEKAGYHGVILVAKDNQVLYEKGYGYANFDTKVRNTTSTVFKTESVGKMFTATAILQLVEANKLKLSQTVKELLPELKIANADKIAIHHLLSHTSGLQSPWDHPAWQWKREYTRAELVKVVEEVPLAFDTPGKGWYYSNSGYFILGWIIEKTTGKPFDKYLKEKFFAPLAMTATRHLGDTVMPANGAVPYQLISSKKYIVTNQTLSPKAGGAGGWISTAKDLHRFLYALNSGKLLKPATLRRMRTANGTAPKDSSYQFYAYGVETSVNQAITGTAIYGHNGGGAGFSIDAYADPATGYIVTSCTNLRQNSRLLMLNYMKAALGKPLIPVEKLFAVRLYDLIDAVGIDSLVKNSKELFRQQGINVDPGTFGAGLDAMQAAGDYALGEKWMGLGRSYFPEETYLWVISGENMISAGNKADAKRMLEKAKELGIKHGDERGAQRSDELLKGL